MSYNFSPLYWSMNLGTFLGVMGLLKYTWITLVSEEKSDPSLSVWSHRLRLTVLSPSVTTAYRGQPIVGGETKNGVVIDMSSEVARYNQCLYVPHGIYIY